MVEGFRFKVRWFGIEGLLLWGDEAVNPKPLGFRVQGLGFRVQGLSQS